MLLLQRHDERRQVGLVQGRGGGGVGCSCLYLFGLVWVCFSFIDELVFMVVRRAVSAWSHVHDTPERFAFTA